MVGRKMKWATFGTNQTIQANLLDEALEGTDYTTEISWIRTPADSDPSNSFYEYNQSWRIWLIVENYVGNAGWLQSRPICQRS